MMSNFARDAQTHASAAALSPAMAISLSTNDARKSYEIKIN